MARNTPPQRKGPLTRNSKCPIHGTHNIRYCPNIKGKLESLASIPELHPEDAYDGKPLSSDAPSSTS